MRDAPSEAFIVLLLPLTTINKKFDFMKFASLFCVACFAVSFVSGQNPADMPLRQVISEAQAMIGKGDFAGASLPGRAGSRFEDEKDPEVEKILQQLVLSGASVTCKVLQDRQSGFFGQGCQRLWFFRGKIPQRSQGRHGHDEKNRLPESAARVERGGRVIETLLDPSKPYKNKS